VGESFLSVIECIHTADKILKPCVLEIVMAMADLKEPHARLPWHLALYISVCSHLKTPVQQAFHSVIPLLHSGISRKHIPDFVFCEGYQAEHSPEIG